MIGGVSGAGIAVGPILGGWATTQLSWRVVFAGEVVLVIFILAMTGERVDNGQWLRCDPTEPPPTGIAWRAPHLTAAKP